MREAGNASRRDGASPLRVLVVEDMFDHAMLIKSYLRPVTPEVVLVRDGRAALRALETHEAAGEPFDLVVMDMVMPEMDGFEATRALRERGFGAPILALTALAMVTDSGRCQDAGCDAYLTKPVDRQMLLRQVSRLTGWSDESMQAA